MSCGAEHSIGLSDKGVMYAWGWGSYGNLGDGERVDRWAPVKVRMHVCLHVQGARLFFCSALGPWQCPCDMHAALANCKHACNSEITPAHVCLPKWRTAPFRIQSVCSVSRDRLDMLILACVVLSSPIRSHNPHIL